MRSRSKSLRTLARQFKELRDWAEIATSEENIIDVDVSYEGMVDEVGLEAARTRAEEMYHYRMALAVSVIEAFF